MNAASTLLRIGVALLGIRITLAQIGALGVWPIAMVVLSVALTIGSAPGSRACSAIGTGSAS